MKYSTPKALEMAVKEAAKKSPFDTNRAIQAFYHHRFLCRVFSDSQCPFTLKGGHSMLARTVDARLTRDIDLTTSVLRLDEALTKLKELSSIDLDDFVTFEFASATPIKSEDEYREGYAVKFDAYLGPKKIQSISIDLVSDEIPCESVDTMQPADRLVIEGLAVFDYQVYPAERSIADKVCALAEHHDGRPSSRVKDLVDITVYATSIPFDKHALSREIKNELRARRLEIESGNFDIPREWGSERVKQYEKLAKDTLLPTQAKTMEGARGIASALINPCLENDVANATWSPDTLSWHPSSTN